MRSFTIVSVVLVILLFSGISFAALPIAENISITGYLSTDNLSASWDVYDGDSDDVRNFTVWSLNGDELPVLYVPFEGSSNAYNATDYAGDDNGGSSVAGAIYNATGGHDGHGAYEFSSSGDYVSLATTSFPPIGSGNYTMMAWIKPAASQISYAGIFGMNYHDPGFYVYNSNYLGVYDSGIHPSSLSNSSITDGNWHHVAFVREGTAAGQLKFYLDGRSLGNSSHQYDIASPTYLYIGIDGSTSDDFYGSIDDVRFYDSALSAEQVAAFAANESNKIVSSMTTDDQNWSICVTPNDGTQDGGALCSSNTTVGVMAETPVSGCQEISSSGEYGLINNLAGANISGDGTSCLKITASGVTLNCYDYKIENNGTGGTTNGILVTTDNVEIINCSVVSDYTNGIKITDSDNVSVDPSSFCNNDVGIFVNQSNNTNIVDAIACNNSQYGILVYDSINTTINDTRLYNNSLDFNINTSSSSPSIPIELNNVTFDNPSGDLNNYTILDIDDTLTISNEEYNINWSSSPSAAPNSLTNIRDGYITITATSTMSIDSAVWHWTTSEGSAFKESTIELYGWNGSDWDGAGESRNVVQNTLTVTNLANESIYGMFGDQNLFGCVELNESGSYYLGADISASSVLSYDGYQAPFGNVSSTLQGAAFDITYACIIINASNVNFDCQGLEIDWDGSGDFNSVSAGIAVVPSKNNITITNCPNIEDFAFNVYLLGNRNVHIENVSSNRSYYGLTSMRTRFSSSDCDNHTYVNVSSYNAGYTKPDWQPGAGLFSIGCINSNYINSTAYSSGSISSSVGIGMRLRDPRNISVNNLTLYNNDYDLNIRQKDIINSNVSMLSLYFLPPTGVFENYTWLDLNDSMPSDADQYSISWWNHPAVSPPLENYSLGQKFVRFRRTESLNTPTIEKLVWHYTDAEVTSESFNETTLKVYSWNTSSSWDDKGATLNFGSNKLTLNNHPVPSGLNGVVYGILGEQLAIPVSSCMEIDQPREYRLINNLAGSPINASPRTGFACLKILADDVVLDCNGYNLSHTAEIYRYAILGTGVSNLTIKNCNAYGYAYGVMLDNTSNSTMRNNYVQNPYDAGFLTDENSHNNTIVDNEVRRTSGTGDYGYRIRGDFVHMYNNTAYFPIGVYADAGLHGIYGNNTFNWSIDGYGFYPRYSYYNIVENNTFHRFDYGVYSWGGNSNNYTNNSIYDNQNVGIFLTSGSLLNRIWENNISNSGTYGIMATSSSKGNVLTNNTITDVNTAIRLDTDADFNEVYDHVIDDVTNTGIYVGDSTSYNNLIMNNNVTGIPTGISVIGAASTRIINNNVTRSSTYGIYVSQGPGTNLSKNHMYNNSRDVALYATSAPAIFMDEMIFDNPLGNYQNYSNISMYDQMSATSRYYFNWTTNSSNPPFVFPSFNEKYVDISSDIGTVSIDSISFQWNDAEVSGYSEGNLEIWKNNGSWTKMISNLNTATNNLSITNLVPNSEYGIFEGLGTGCEDITVPGTYLLGFDAYGAPFSVPDVNYVDYTCFRIMANHVRFDCNGYAITNLNHMDDAAAITIYGNTTADYTNVTIENCGNISDYEIGIALHQTSGDTIRNVTLINASGDIAQSYGIWTYNTSDSQFYNLTVRNSSWDGIRTGSGTNNTFHDNHLYDNYRYGLYTAGGSNFSIYDNNMSNNGDSGLAHNNPSSRIYSNLLEANDGVGMNVQSAGNNISDNIVRHSTGSGYYIIGNSNNLTNNTAFNNTVSGFQISYTSNVIISNCTANKNGYGLSLSSQYNLTIEDVHLFNNTKDFYIMASSGGTDYYVAKNMTIDRDAGDFNRDTHLYINDTLTEFDETYTIDHAFQPTTLPPFRATFDNKYVNITQVNGDVSINNITWKWEDSEIGSADEAELEIWKHNGSWSNTGATIKTNTNSLSLSAMDPQSTYAMLEDISSLGSTPVYGCIEISDPGTYTIANGIDAASFVLYGDYTAPDGNISPVLQGNAYNIDYACILINSSNVVLNCNGSYIDWPTGPQLADTAAIALVPGSDNVIIQNCSLISDFEYGIYSLGSDAVEVSNVTINHTQHGFFSARTKFSSNDCQNNIFANSNVSDGGFGGPDYEPGSGINYIGCHESTIENVTVSKTGTGGINHGYGVILDETYNATLANVILYDNDKDLVVDPGSFTDVSLNATNLDFMWDGGTPAQYVRLDLEDNFEDLTASSPYAITGTNISESALPAWARSFENKYLDIEYLRTKATGQEINSTTWHWTSTEVASGPYVESRFDMYVSKWISSILYVQELNLVPNTTDNYMKLEHFSPEGIYGLMEDPELITGCMDITSSGRYRLANDIVGTQVAKNKCIEILADDVVIDMNGHYIVQTFVDAGTGFGIFNRGYDGTKIYGSDGHIVGYEFGMLFDTSTGVDIDPLYLCNNTIGLLVNNSNDTIINDTIACNNSEIGIYILDSDNTTIYDSRTFNNTIDLKINNTLGTPITLNMLSLIFDRPAGDNTSFTNMTINDSIAAGESYQINWSTTPSPLPGGYSSFKNKFVDVSNLTSSVSIDEIIWRWNETEITGADNESAFELWKYNGSWSNTSAALDTGNNTLTLTNMNPASDYGILQSSVSTCMLITSPGDYVLTSNVEGAPYNMLGITSGASNACIGIASSNVTFDCDGYNITNNGTTNAAGIIINSSLSYPNLLYDNVTIQNCPAISGYDDGIVLDQVNTTTVSNSTVFNNSNTGILLNGRSSAPYNYVVLDYVDIHNNSDGFIAYFGSHVNITNSRAWNNSNAGVKLENEYVEIELNNYTAWDNTYGVHLTGPFSSGTEPWANVYNSEFYNNSYGFYGLGTEGPDVPLGNITIANTTFYENAIGIYHGYNADLLFGFIYLEHFLTLDNVTVNSSSSIGASLYKSSVNANGLVFTNNTQDVLFNNSDDFNPMNFSLDMNMTFLNPAATYVNYTNLTLNDVLRNNESYSMTWTTNSSTLPTDYTSFEQKFINITPTLGTPTIETTTWHWTDTEAASYTEANLELWKWNGSWSDTGATLSEAANTLTLSNYDPASDYGILEG
ncbi:right-handed parallel beta-helix repeat-containing protein, partial [Candidatus Micrarchaeota archaeon]|nr:right-handed parallel beta-helix repeat-containing protein [Candidatus Micrarchaeota archaeon]